LSQQGHVPEKVKSWEVKKVNGEETYIVLYRSKASRRSLYCGEVSVN
jgi:hypothetical protein